MRRLSLLGTLVVSGLLCYTPITFGQDEPPPPTTPEVPAPAPAPAPAPDKPPAEPAKPVAPAANAGGGGRGGGRGGAPAANPNEPRPYDQVITKEAKTQPGIFKVHQVGTNYFYEIPAAELGKDFLLEAQIKSNTIGAGYGGRIVDALVVRWERRDNRILLKNINYDITADPKSPIALAVNNANTPAILMSFQIAALGPENAPVIDITRLYSADLPELSARQAVRGRGMDASRSFIDKMTAFPTNIETESTQTYTTPTEGGGGNGGRGGNQPAMRPGSGTVVVHTSMVKLPEVPMKGRLADSRVGYFSTETMDFSQAEPREERRTYIDRWRLEKKDPKATVSEPVKPIVYYVDPATPSQWVPWVKKAIESWQPAFEAAGFKNAIIAKEAPSKEEDPNWSPEDARYSVIRWLPSTTENASGPHISDPRTGEIINADIQLYNNVLNLVRDWYFVQAGPLDPRAKQLPLPDSLMGELVQFVVAHEIGHTLGLEHNMKASANYPVDKLRDPQWLKTMGHTPSIMDYSRFNYLVQPEDHIDPELLIPHQGPYDVFAIKWGYSPIEAGSPDDEKKVLDTWSRQQDTTPWLRFSTEGSGDSDPGENTEAVGDADAVYSTGLGLKNLARVMQNLLPATTHDGEDWSDLEQVYGRVLGQWSTELNHVTAIVGGLDSQDKHAGQRGVRFTPISKQRQQAAVKFLNENAFKTPMMFVNTEILRRMEPSGTLQRLRTAQLRVLTPLMSTQRFRRLTEQEAIDGAAAYKPLEFLSDLRHGIWGEIYQPQVTIDAYRRNLQRAYLELLSTRINANSAGGDDQRPMLRGELRTISADAVTALQRTTDRATRFHLEDVRDQIARMLDPKFLQQAPQQGQSQILQLPSETWAPKSLLKQDEACWTDYAVVLDQASN